MQNLSKGLSQRALGGALGMVLGLCQGCGSPPNSPYPDGEARANTLYTSFESRPKHLDPARAYSQNEYELIAQVVEPPLQYAYLKRPYTLEPLALARLPQQWFEDAKGHRLPEDSPAGRVAETVYELELRDDLRYAPHPAFAKNVDGSPRYLSLTPETLGQRRRPLDFETRATRPVRAEDLAYQIKRLAHPEVHSPVGEWLADVVVGLRDLGERLREAHEARGGEGPWLDLREFPLKGVEVLGPTRLRIRIHGVYPQFRFWLAMPFFAPLPFEVDAFYAQPLLKSRNLILDWYPVGSGPYQLIDNNPNRQMVLARNPDFHPEHFPLPAEPEDLARGLDRESGKRLPLIDRIVFVLEKETIPYWSKFLQGYYDASGLASDNFDQAIQFSGLGQAELTPAMTDKGIALETTVNPSILYLGFNMQDPVVGGLDAPHSALRRAISLAIDIEEFIAIFMNGRGIPAQGPIPPGIFGYEAGEAGINPEVYRWVEGRASRRPLEEAKALLREAGYPGGMDPRTQRPLVLYLDTTLQGADDKPLLNWYRKQFQKLGLELVLRTTDYNQFQQKMAQGNAQLFRWGWNADYPDPENFLFLLFGPNSKALRGGENAANYQNPQFDQAFLEMRNLPDGPERLARIRALEALIRRDAPWVFGVHPQAFTLHHAWYHNSKPNLMANNHLKYLRIDPEARALARAAWNPPVLWPLPLMGLFALLPVIAAYRVYRQRREARGRG